MKKIFDLVAKGKITQGDVDDANEKEKYTPITNTAANTNTGITDTTTASVGTGVTNSNSTNPTKSQIPFTDSASFLAYLKTDKTDYNGYTAISALLKSIKENADKGLTSQEIADFGGTLAGIPISAADVDVLKTIANDDATMKVFNDGLAAAPKPVYTSTNSGTSKKAKKIMGMKPSVAIPVFIVIAIGITLIALKIHGGKKVIPALGV
jgi:hypothetical protein